MAIESAANLRGLRRAGLVIALGMFSFSSAASAQKNLVSTGSVIQLPLGISSACQVYKIINAPNGDTVMLDVCGGGGYGSLYQLKKGSTTFQLIATPIDSAGTYWNEGLAMDAKGTLYITDRYSGSQHIYRVPYNPADGTWDYSASGDNWYPQLAGGFSGAGTIGIAFQDSPAKDGSGLLFVSEETASSVVIVPVNADGTIPNFSAGAKSGQSEYQYLLTGLTSKVMPMDIDVNGNFYFIENPYVTSANRATGIFFIPASTIATCVATMKAGTSPDTGCISGESSLQRIDPGNSEKFNGITHDAAGNIYVGDASDSYSGTRNGLLMIPNESGSPIGVTATSFNFEHAEYLAPVAVNANPSIDYRGFIWLPTGTVNNWSPAGSGQVPGTGNFVVWQPGSATLAPTPVGTAGSPGLVFFTFSGNVTPASIALTQPNGGGDFIASTTNPFPPPAGTTPAVPCLNTAGTTYTAYSSCQYWVALDPSGTNAVGNVQGQISMLDNSSNIIGGSTAYLQGIGQGPEAALLSPVMQTPLATSLTQPAQVAGDSLGNAYVADPGQHAVLMFPAGGAPFGGAPVGSGLTAPTGVAVDGNNDVYIADSGKIIEIPAVGGTLNPAGQTTRATGLGSNVQLTVDGADNVYAADPSNARVVRLYNPQAAVMEGTGTIGTGFTKPTAVAVDNAGNLFVADGSSLVEITPWGAQTSITSGLVTPVTGLAVDPSGAVYVAQSGGIIRIPLTSSGLNPNNAATVDNNGVTAPSGLGLDALGNLYVTASSYNVTTMNTTGTPLGPVTSTVSTPNVLMLANAAVNFGIVDTATTTDPSDISVFNIGNAPLLFSATTQPVFGGTNASDYAIQQDGQVPCDITGATSVPSGTACTLGVTVTAANNALSQGTLNFATNAVNVATTSSATLEAYAENNLCRTTTTIVLTPSTGVSYPGATSVAATVAASDPTCSPGNVPTGGKISLTLAPQAKGAAQTILNSTVTNGQASFSVSALNGGAYNVYASYKGDPIYGGSSSSKTYTFTVAQAASSTALTTPAGVTPINGVYYVKQGSSTVMTATVTSSKGKPTGTVTFMNGSTVLGTSPLNASGQATFNTSNLAAGSSQTQLGQVYNITAVYSGDINFAAATSPASPIEIVPQSVLITATPPSITTKAGTPVQSTITVTPLEGYGPKPGTSIFCDNSTLPQYAECTFDVPTLDFGDDSTHAPLTSHVTISSNLPVNVGALRKGPSPVEYAGLFGLGILGLALRRKTRLNVKLFTAFCLVLLGGATSGLVGCTNSGYTKTPPAPQVTTPSGTYQVSIYTVDLSTNQRSSLPFTLTLTVQ